MRHSKIISNNPNQHFLEQNNTYKDKNNTTIYYKRTSNKKNNVYQYQML